MMLLLTRNQQFYNEEQETHDHLYFTEKSVDTIVNLGCHTVSSKVLKETLCRANWNLHKVQKMLNTAISPSFQ